MNYFDLMRAAQGGRAMSNLGKRFGLSEDQATQAVQHMLPTMTNAIARNTASPQGLGSLLGALGSGKHERYFEDAGIFMDGNARNDGVGILGHLFGTNDQIQKVAQHASQQTGLSSAIIQQMMPYVAAMFMGSIFKRTKGPLEGVLSQVTGGAIGGGNSFGMLSRIVASGGKLDMLSMAAGMLSDKVREKKAGVGNLIGGLLRR